MQAFKFRAFAIDVGKPLHSCLVLYQTMAAPNTASCVFAPPLLPVSDPVLHLPLPVRMGAVADACLGLRSGFGVMPDCLN